MARGPDRLSRLLDDLLDGAVEALTPVEGDAAPQPEGAPARRFVSHGPPVPECADGQLSVHAAAIRFEQDRGNPCFVQIVFPLVVALYRCVPTVTSGGLPSADAMTTSALALSVDAQALADRLTRGCKDGTLFPTAGIRCDSVTWTPGLLPQPPQGGLAGWTFGLEVRP